MKMRVCDLIYVFCALFVILRAEGKELSVSSMFSNNMVLQRGIQVPVWGEARPHAEVVVEFNGQKKIAKANSCGEWMIRLAPMKFGGPYDMRVLTDEVLIFKNVMVGDVWICAGQSNMKMCVRQSWDAKTEILAAHYPNMRLFNVRERLAHQPSKSLMSDGWKVCSPKTISSFSAVGYYFGRDLCKEFNVPIGLISVAYSGSPAEAWTDIKILEADPAFKSIIDEYKRSKDSGDALRKFEEHEKVLKDLNRFRSMFGKRHKIVDKTWTLQDFDDTAWNNVDLPESGQTDLKPYSVVAFRKRMRIPEEWAGKDLLLSLGKIVNYDVVFWDGHEIGRTMTQSSRKYIVPGEYVKAGTGLIAIRVGNEKKGACDMDGFIGSPKDMYLGLRGGRDKISLSGSWKYHVEETTRPLSSIPLYYSKYAPAVIYNGMLKPIIPYAIKGLVWYQGESNTQIMDRVMQYRKLLPLMITDWREKWKQGDFPFLIVQLANFKKPSRIMQNDSTWAALRDAQLKIACKLPKCGIAVAIDAGEANNIHPKNKRIVGERLALLARNIAYKQDIVCSGPIYDSMLLEGDKIRIKFKNIGGGLIVNGDRLNHFSIAGKDKKFVVADARIEDKDVIVSNKNISEPVAVRYAWADNPKGCELYNKEGLPASPFRTDGW